MSPTNLKTLVSSEKYYFYWFINISILHIDSGICKKQSLDLKPFFFFFSKQSSQVGDPQVKSNPQILHQLFIATKMLSKKPPKGQWVKTITIPFFLGVSELVRQLLWNYLLSQLWVG